MIYKTNETQNLDEDSRNSAILDELVADSSCNNPDIRLVIVDDHSRTGVKAFDTLLRLKHLGYQRSSFASLTTPNAAELENADFIEKNIGLLQKVGQISFGKALLAFKKGGIAIDAVKDFFVALKSDCLHDYMENLAELISSSKYFLREYDGIIPYQDHYRILEAEINSSVSQALSAIGSVSMA